MVLGYIFRLEAFTLLTKRTVDITLKLDKTLHVYRPVFFDSTCFAAVTMALHCSLVSVIPVRKKLPPDPVRAVIYFTVFFVPDCPTFRIYIHAYILKGFRFSAKQRKTL